jgi:hypothetical protein
MLSAVKLNGSDESVITPSQWSGMHTAERPDWGTVALVLAVLEDGLCCYGGRPGLTNRAAPTALQIEAAAWIDDRTLWVFSYEFCCEHLSIDSERLREAIHGDKAAAIILALRSSHRKSAQGEKHCRRRREKKASSRVRAQLAMIAAPAVIRPTHLVVSRSESPMDLIHGLDLLPLPLESDCF